MIDNKQRVRIRFKNKEIFRIYKLPFLGILFLFLQLSVLGQQKDTANKITIEILNSKNAFYNKTDSGEYNKFIGDVIFKQGSDTLYCDSAYQNTTTKNFEAFSNVKIIQKDGTKAFSNYLRYTANTKEAYMQENVSLTDGKNKLHCNELTYNVGTKTGVYKTGGTLETDSTTVSSTEGVYNVQQKEARFTKNVIVKDARYNIKSEDLTYNTDTKVITFYSKSVITNDKSILNTSNGTYNSKTGIAHFTGHSSLYSEEHYLEGDSLYYNKISGYGYADGHVISIDTIHHSKLYCGHAEYFKKQRVLWATIKPVLEQVNGKDTIYIRADTFHAYPLLIPKVELIKSKKKSVITIADTINKKANIDTNDIVGMKQENSKKINKKNNKHSELISKKTNTIIDSTAADTTAPMLFVGYHHVRIFSDSMQGKCDSISYSRADSTIRLIYAPVMWSHQSQILGDTMILHIDDSGGLKSLYVPNNAFMVSQTGPEIAKLFDQIQGKTLTAYFKDNAITKMVVFPNAESIYYSKDAKGAYIGETEGTSEKMKIYFENKNIKKIHFEIDVHQAMTPMEKVDFSAAHLSRFKWLIKEKPMSKQDLFE